MRTLARYGRERIRRGAIHFLLGKGLSSIAGFAVLLLLVRGLPVTEFAAYSVLQAFVYVFTAITGFGLLHVTLRYVPELYARHENRIFRGFVLWAFSLRFMLLTFATIFAYGAGVKIAGAFGLAGWVTVFKAYLAVVWVRVNSHFLFQILESTLHQGVGQAAFVVTTLLKLVFVAWLIASGGIDLTSVVWAELIAELAGLLMFLAGVISVLHEAHAIEGTSGFAAWWSDNARRVTSYGLAGYIQQLAIMPYGSAPNRLVSGRFLETASVAAFGFAQSFIDVINRYLPAQLLGGLIRPVLVARFATQGDFGEVARILTYIFRINTVLLGLLLALLLAVGAPAVEFISGGKYGADAAALLAAMVGVLVLESRRFLLDMAIQAVEQYKVLVIGNLGLAASLLLAVGLLPSFGAMAIPLASGIGLLASNAWIAHRLRRTGFPCPFAFLDFSRAAASTLAAAGFGHIVAQVVSWQGGLATACVAYPALLWITGAVRRDDWGLLRHLRRASSTVPGNETVPGEE